MKLLKGNIIHAPALGTLETIENGALVLEDNGTIREVLHKAPKHFDGAIYDYSGQLIMQSFADMHLHAPQYPSVGMGMDLPLLDWLKTYTFPAEARFADMDYARRVYHKLAHDLIANGTTRVVMFSSMHTDATLILMEELENAGVTGYVGKVNMDRNGGENLEETTEESMRETLRWLNECRRFTYVKPILTPRFTPSCTDELMAWLGRLAQEKHLYVQSHLSENRDEIDWVRSLHPDCAQYWESYDKYGLWKDHTVMAHCIHSDKQERNAIKRAGVVVAHCPDSNINLCSGIAPVREMLDEGIRVTLGTDIAAGSSAAMNQAVTMSIRASKIRSFTEPHKPAFLTVPEAYYLGTTSGHRYFGAGSGFAAGDKLHAVVVDDRAFTEAAGALTLSERLERALYTMTDREVTAVWSEGRRVLGEPAAAQNSAFKEQRRRAG